MLLAISYVFLTVFCPCLSLSPIPHTHYRTYSFFSTNCVRSRFLYRLSLFVLFDISHLVAPNLSLSLFFFSLFLSFARLGISHETSLFHFFAYSPISHRRFYLRGPHHRSFSSLVSSKMVDKKVLLCDSFLIDFNEFQTNDFSPLRQGSILCKHFCYNVCAIYLKS